MKNKQKKDLRKAILTKKELKQAYILKKKSALYMAFPQ